MSRFVATCVVLACMAAAPAVASAASPSVVTDPATGIGNTSATLNGRVNPGGQATTYAFQYGTTTQYASQTSTRSAGTGTVAKKFSRGISRLTPGTVYHFRIVAANASGVAVGADRSFRTHGVPPPGVFTGAATGVSLTGATLTGLISPLGLASSYYFQYGLTGLYGLRTNAQSVAPANAIVPVGAGVFGLTPHRLYHYRLVASTRSGTTPGEDRVFDTGRFAPRGVTRNARPRHVARRGVVTITGALHIPSGFPPVDTCKGQVRIRILSGRRIRVRAATPLLAGLCRYVAQIRLPRSVSGSVHVQARFLGNALLTPRSARTQTITVG